MCRERPISLLLSPCATYASSSTSRWERVAERLLARPPSFSTARVFGAVSKWPPCWSLTSSSELIKYSPRPTLRTVSWSVSGAAACSCADKGQELLFLFTESEDEQRDAWRTVVDLSSEVRGIG